MVSYGEQNVVKQQNMVKQPWFCVQTMEANNTCFDHVVFQTQTTNHGVVSQVVNTRKQVAYV
eukprot:6987279-Lingulodinium_polyedra.AAC.1